MGKARYVLTYTRQKTIVTQKFLDLTSGVQKLAAELLRYPEDTCASPGL